MLETSLVCVTDVVQASVVERTGFEEGYVKARGEFSVHVFVNDVICFTTYDAGFEEIVGKLANEGVWCSGVGPCDDGIGRSEEN